MTTDTITPVTAMLCAGCDNETGYITDVYPSGDADTSCPCGTEECYSAEVFEESGQRAEVHRGVPTDVLAVREGDVVRDPSGTGTWCRVLTAYRPDFQDGTRCFTLSYPEGTGCAYVLMTDKIEVTK